MAFATPTVVGGNKTVGTATLECKAALGPITVELESSRPAVAYPVAASISVPQGTKSATFDVATKAVLSKTTATISGSANGIAKSKELTITPVAVINRSVLYFRSVSVGTTGGTLGATLRNKGALAFSVGRIASWAPTPPVRTDEQLPADLTAGASCTTRLTFKPLSVASRSARLSIATSATSTPLIVRLSGAGT